MPDFFRSIDKSDKINFKYIHENGNMEVINLENSCINDKEVLSAIENFEIMLTQLIKRLKTKKLGYY